MERAMIIDARTQSHPDHKEGTLSGAVRAFLDTLPLDGPVVWLEKSFDAKGNPIDSDVIIDITKRIRKVGERFSTRRRLGVTGIWKIANAHEADSEFTKRKHRTTWPFADMQVGDVITVKYGQYGKSNHQAYVHTYAKQSGRKYTTKRHEDSFIIERIA